MSTEKFRILIIEDNKDLNEMFNIAFDNEKFEIKSALNGIDGLTLAGTFRPHLILLDIMMPQMNGYEVLEAMKKSLSFKPIVVVNSNLEQEKDAEKALTLGADYYLKKSEYTPLELVHQIEAILEKDLKTN